MKANWTNIRSALCGLTSMLLLLGAGESTTRAASITQQPDDTLVSAAGNPSSRLAYLDMSFSVGKTQPTASATTGNIFL